MLREQSERMKYECGVSTYIMRGEIQQWFAQHPRTMNAVFTAMWGYVLFAEYAVSPFEAIGGTAGP